MTRTALDPSRPVAQILRELAGDVTLEQLHRTELMLQAELDRPRLSTLIARLADAPAGPERERLIRDIGARR